MAHFLSVVGFGLQVAAGEIVHLHSSGKLVYRVFFFFSVSEFVTRVAFVL